VHCISLTALIGRYTEHTKIDGLSHIKFIRKCLYTVLSICPFVDSGVMAKHCYRKN